MAEPLISLLLEQITQVITQQVQEEVNLVRGVNKQAEKLKSNLIDIQAVLEDAERKQVKEKTVRVWLDKLKDVCYDMDDVLDEWSYAILTWKTGDAEENIHNQQKIRCSFLGSPCFCLNQAVQRRDIALKIKEVSEKVDEIANERARHGLQIIKATDHEPQQQKRTSTSQVDELNVYGRDYEKKNVVSKLLAESSQEARNVDVISLVGLGGIGKTTLAQLAFNHDDVMTHFEKKMWVCVSEAFDDVRIAKAMLEELEDSTPNLVELQSLLRRVSQSIKGIRFLLVLDDVWTENHEHWEQLERSLTGCARGSRILVTTRNANVATMMRTNHRINIDTLSEDACRSIFNHLAFHERGKDECERLTDIGNEIANKCKGLPLAAKVLGGLMQSKRTREEWECVLSSELWRLDEVDEDRVEQLFVPLLLSYYDLPSVVRRCFLYCAMFPKDYLMKKDELVKMWMAQGYLKRTGNRDMEIVGEDCFQVLAARSFFQDIQNDGREDLRFKMHDIVHDFAQYMTKNECLILDDNNFEEVSVETSIARVRHLSMMLSRETTFPPSIQRAKGLRSLLIDNSGDPSLGAALPDVIKQLTCIRSLNLSQSSIEEIPKEVRKLIHLRHLNLKVCRKLVSLPENMCDLSNLQSLNVSWCSSLKELPGAIGKLIKLRHLCIYESGVVFMPKGIERLTCLRTLDCFPVCGGGENESKAANLRELKNLDHIGGRLEIRNLQGGIEDAAEALLKNKKRLLCLELHFNHNHEDDNLIEVLQPPSDLERLYISGYGGIVLPNWMMALTRLQELRLVGCGNLEVLPPLGRLPNLETLILKGVGVRRLDAAFLGIEEVENANNINEGEIARVTAFPKLKTLRISFLSKLEEWDGIERRVGEEDATTTSMSIMPQLQHLEIKTCPLLRALPDYVLAASLQELRLIDCGNLEVLPPLGRLPNLESLELMNVGVRRLYAGFLGIEEVENANINEGEIARVTTFPKLKILVISNLLQVQEWDGIERRVGEELRVGTLIFILPQLQKLRIQYCPLLRALPDYVLAASLQELELIDFGNLEVLPPLGRLPNLEFLRLQTLGVRRLDAGFVGIEEVENDIINEGEIARVTTFPKLKRLVIWDLEEVEEWDGIERRVGEELRFGTSMFIMPQLRELTIFKCPLLRALPDYVLAAPLQLLDITGCPNLKKRYEKEKAPFVSQFVACGNVETRLQELQLAACGNVEVLPPFGRLPNLESLKLKGVGVRRLDAGFLGIEEVENANNINEGEIARVTAFPKLKRLRIEYLKELEEWDGIERRVGEEDATTTSIFIIMPQLQQLTIEECPLLRALPDYVGIQHCPNLSKRYGKEEKGEDWHKICHIQNVTVD
uniref:NB-ARC domain-containing protein n=1 Tax=Salix viminalis TaxID=40686 RepID=A0A6N2MJU1_SALVM